MLCRRPTPPPPPLTLTRRPPPMLCRRPFWDRFRLLHARSDRIDVAADGAADSPAERRRPARPPIHWSPCDRAESVRSRPADGAARGGPRPRNVADRPSAVLSSPRKVVVRLGETLSWPSRPGAEAERSVLTESERSRPVVYDWRGMLRPDIALGGRSIAKSEPKRLSL